MHIPFQEILSIQDAEHVLNNSGKNFLSIELSPGGFSYCVLDTERFKYTLLESFRVENKSGYSITADFLEYIAKEKKFLTAYYQRISLSLLSQGVTLVPAELFSYLEKGKFIDFNVYPDKDYEVKVDKLNNLSAYALYPFPKVLLQKVNYLFPGCRIRHISTSLIENILYMVRYGRFSPQLVLSVQEDQFQMMIFDNSNLVFYNLFSYKTVDDLFYYLFFVLEQLELQAEKLDAMLYGEVSIESELYKKIRLYVKSVSFGPRSELFKYSDCFDDIPHHYYFSLLNLNSCG